MAREPCFILRHDYPSVLRFRDGWVALEITATPRDHYQHVFRARKQGTDKVCVIAGSPYGRWHLEAMLFRDGIMPLPGSPELKIVRVLETLGYARREIVRT